MIYKMFNDTEKLSQCFFLSISTIQLTISYGKRNWFSIFTKTEKNHIVKISLHCFVINKKRSFSFSFSLNIYSEKTS